MAQPHEFANITEFAGSLTELAAKTRTDGAAITTQIFERALSEGPESVKQLHDLLEFRSSKHSTWSQKSGSTAADRLETQLRLLEEVARDFESAGGSIRSRAADVARVRDKVKIARSFGKVRRLHPDAALWKKLAEEKGLDSNRLTTRIFEQVVDEAACHRPLNELLNLKTVR